MIAVMDFKFFAGSMGSVVGEKITRAVELAIAEKRGVIIISASSGARMQEGMFSLMQMAKTCGALARLAEAKLPYISILTHPTTGGVTASFATIGDVNLAEPKCMIGFAGPRVVKETTHQNLPPGFQTAEFMLQHGLIDAIVPRAKLRERLASLLAFMLPRFLDQSC
jgi:acetyl-CoA carboxylase carboxyl transferase subunit beta